MANEGSALAVLPGWRTQVSLGDAGFLALLLLVFVGVSPFAVRDANALLHGADEAGSGNLVRQASYLAVFAAAGFAGMRVKGLRIAQAIPVSLLLLLAWCIASAAWSAEPAVALRRAGLECIIVAAVFFGVSTLG
jgi:hypothetical protein